MIFLVKIILASFIAGALDTVVGFAGALLLLPALALILGGSAEAVLLSAVISLGWNAVRTVALPKIVDWRSAGLIALGILPGALIGAKFFASFDPAILRILIAVVLIVCGAYFILRLYVELPERGGWVRDWMLPPIGLLTGGISAVIGAGNGPLHMITLRGGARRHIPQAIAATTGMLGLLTAAVRLIGYNGTGSFPKDLWLPGVAGLAGAVAGGLAGLRLSRRAHDSTLELVIGAAIVLAGVRLLF